MSGELYPEKTVADYKIQNESTLYIVTHVYGGGGTNPSYGPKLSETKPKVSKPKDSKASNERK